MFAHNIRGRWWCDSKGWTLPPIFCSTLLRDGWKQKSCLRKCHLTLKCVWSRGAELNSFMWEKMAPIDILWHLLNMYGDQKVDVSTVRAGWCISAVMTVTWKSLKSCSRQPCAAITPQVKSISISSSAWISGSRPGDCVQSWILQWNFSALETVVTMSEYHSLCQDGPMNADAGTERTPYANLLGPIEPMQGWWWQFLGSHNYW